MRSAKFLIVAAMAAGCDEPSTPIDRYQLPPTATNVRELGNGWHTFDVEIKGRSHTFIHRVILDGSASPRSECLSEIKPQ